MPAAPRSAIGEASSVLAFIMSEVLVEIADIAATARFEDARVGSMIGATLRDHVRSIHEHARPGLAPVGLTLRSVSGQPRTWRQTAVAGNQFTVEFGSEALDGVPNRFYYRVLLPTLTEILGELDRPCFHAALMITPAGRSVLVAGHSGDGKTTLAGACLLAGGALLSDDIAIWSHQRSQWFGLRRPLNVGPQSKRWLHALDGLDAAKPYLPGRDKVAYEGWLGGAPSQPIARLDAIAETSVDASIPTLVERSSRSPSEILRSAQENETKRGVDEVVKPQGRLVTLTMRWGQDAWIDGATPIKFVDDVLNQSSRSSSS